MRLQTGEAAPWFITRSTSNDRYHFHSVGGRLVVLAFVGSAAHPYARAVLQSFYARRAVFDDEGACFFAVTCDPADEAQGRVQQLLPGYRVFWDFDRRVSTLYGVTAQASAYSPCSIVLDERLRVLSVLPFDPGTSAERHVDTVMDVVARHASASRDGAAETHAPILIVPRVFEPDFCRRLVDYYRSGTSTQSGFMQERDGMTVGALDDGFKRRRDVSVEDPDLRAACRSRLVNRLKPEVHRAFQFVATYAERYIVACYDGVEGGFFRAHRDNTTRGTAHRRFAVTLNLNTGDYDGGLLRFPEFGQRTYEAPLGGAVVFSCSLLHEATPVVRGERYAFLPFLYDEPAAQVRNENLRFVAGE